MRLTRCLLRYGGMCAPEAQSIVARQGLPVQNGGEKNLTEAGKISLPTGGLEPPIFGLGDRRLIH